MNAGGDQVFIGWAVGGWNRENAQPSRNEVQA